jgi:hypothetical protein
MEYIKIVLNGNSPEVFNTKKEALNWLFQLMIDQLKYMSLDGIKNWIIEATMLIEQDEDSYQLKRKLNYIRENCERINDLNEIKKYLFNSILQLDGLGVTK